MRTEDAKFVVFLVEAFADLFPETQSGPTHIVIEDLNLEDNHIDWCLERKDTWSPQSRVQTEAFLRFLKTLPEEWRSSQAVYGHD